MAVKLACWLECDEIPTLFDVDEQYSIAHGEWRRHC
jgi:hypothetical protein